MRFPSKEEKDAPPRKSARVSRRKRLGDEIVGREGCAALSDNHSFRTGPWTKEEHAAFMEGHDKYGNQWIRISDEFVPTRTPKQIGSHALAYFTSQGQWEGRGQGFADGVGTHGNREEVESEADIDARPKRVRHILLGHLSQGEQLVEVMGERATSSIIDYRKSGAAVSTKESLRSRSNWSDAEHEAFLEGHKVVRCSILYYNVCLCLCFAPSNQNLPLSSCSMVTHGLRYRRTMSPQRHRSK